MTVSTRLSAWNLVYVVLLLGGFALAAVFDDLLAAVFWGGGLAVGWIDGLIKTRGAGSDHD